MKRCPGCQAEKPLELFGMNKSRPDGLAYYCKECFQAVSRASYRRRRKALGKSVCEPRHGGTRAYHLRRRYGISEDEVAAMALSQARACPICRRDLTAPSRIAPGVYDVAGTAWRRQEPDERAG